MNRSGLLLAGMALAILGYGVAWAAWTRLNPQAAPEGRSWGTLEALTPTRKGKA